MSRFQNLEFGESPKGRAASTPPLKDEGYYLAEARESFAAGRFERGLRAYAKVLEFNPRNAAAWSGQVRMLIELQEEREANLWADKGLEVFPTDPELLAAKAVALARCGDLRAALAFSDAAVEERGSSPYVWLARADVLLARQEKTAGYCFDKALALASFDWFFVWLAARIHAFYGQFAKAMQLVQSVIESAADRAVLWMLLGECQAQLGLATAAKCSLAQARELDPDALVTTHPPEGLAGWASAVRGWWRRWRG